MSEIFTKIYVDFQAVLTREYENDVAKPVEDLRLAMEKEQGFSIPRSLPMMGGTTATTAIVVDKYLSLAWVGDSRAVLCGVGENGVLYAQELSADHNVEASAAERERAEAKGGVVVGKHIVVDGAEGMVQVLRSLGDVPHHKNDIITAQPEVSTIEIDPAHHAFVMLASDGVWGAMTSLQAVTKAFSQLQTALSAFGKDPPAATLQKVLLETCVSFEDDVTSLCAQAGRQRDDMVVCLLAVQEFDFSRLVTLEAPGS
eukprot:Tamp_15809.p1 GENE.Tamp_15809~~Tamp_15809.p1  ORF type:complete len:257 (+),score=42.38 Tamp_15809:554-1324(+)